MSDFFDTIKTKPKSSSGKTRGIPEVSVSDIQDFISPKLYSELSWDKNRSANDVTTECIEQAKILAESLLHLVDEQLNLYSETQKEIVKNLTVYALYCYNGDRTKARVYMERAERLISNRYGSLDSKRDEGVPVAAIRVPE